ncbi:hypothetical protein [Shewanella colwelliana]|uniref:hypothetical protein n=1 Tax=Shewanella colwelliana TaxID=23 RepID=UPI00056B7604|nr:hypothetical protein [Shewanella colwelliana]
MNYKERFIKAVLATKELGLKVDKEPLPIEKALSKSKLQSIQLLCFEVLKFRGYSYSSDLAQKCIPVHLDLKHFLKLYLDVDSYITVGDRYWDDYVYCEMSYESIKDELANPGRGDLKAHVWLTLSDGTLLDCTAEAHADLIFGRPEYPIEQCIMLIKPTEVNDAKKGFHRPYLVGIDFLEKSGACRVDFSL